MATLKVPITAEDHAQGAENADVTLVALWDYQCGIMTVWSHRPTSSEAFENA